ncbi:hypothetical protein CQW23_03615 [Capsicum baccatum]|uniref:Ubiquitin-like protease family profile domain-containing protein n=1 Tax=Capsicum baccatum TaxID=33114 RepID=A0A2G2XCF1_CAPBA|nr:hypothetical protein CQW23_03615 [Capsicum baccatum]
MIYSSVAIGRLYVATDNILGAKISDLFLWFPTDYSSIVTDFTTSSECSACKFQDCKAKHDGKVNAINALTTSADKMISKRSVIPSKKISYPDTPLEIKSAKRRRKDTSKALSSIRKARFQRLCLCLASMYCQQQSEVFQNEECLINIIKGFSIPADLPWHLVDEVYVSINCGDEFHWVLAVVVLKEKSIRVYDSMSRRRCFGPLSEIQKLAKILLTYLDMSGFGKKGIAVLLLPPTPSICAMDYKYPMMDLMPDYFAKDFLLFYGNTEKRKLKIYTQLMLKIHDDQSQIP